MPPKTLPIRLDQRFAVFTGSVILVLLTSATALGLEHLHTLSPAYHATIIEAEESGTYTFHSPGISYGAVLGKTFGARIRLTFFFPVHLFQEGAYFHTRDYYSPAFGGEALLGASYTLHLIDDQRLVFDVGPSFNALKLDSEIYQSFMSATFGIGAGVEYTYPLSRVLTLGMFLCGAVHFLDFIHDTNGLKVGAFITAGITLGLSFSETKESRR